MHDAVIRFYKLDVKVGVQHQQNANLINLLTSIVLRNPVYSEVHSLIRLIHKPQYKKIISTIEKVRTKYNLEEELSISQVDIGMQLLKNKTREENNSQFLESEVSQSTDFKHLEQSFGHAEIQPQDEINTASALADSKRTVVGIQGKFEKSAARKAFKSLMLKIEQVRNISSPILKVITVQRIVDELNAAIMGVESQKGQVAEADNLI